MFMDIEAPKPLRERILPLDEAKSMFVMQLEIFPELMDEFETLSAKKIGVEMAIVETVGDEISYTPMEATTTQRIRQILGAPEDDSQLDKWRMHFWDQFKARTEIQ
jgi:hypothetical protein